MSFAPLKQGDTTPLEATLRDRNGPVQLDNIGGVEFHMKHRREPVAVAGPCTVVDAASGRVRFNWDSTDLDVPGMYDAEFQLTDSSGHILTFPSNGYLEIRVEEQIA